MNSLEQLINRRKWLKQNIRQLRTKMDVILKGNHEVNSGSYIHNKELLSELDFFFSNKEEIVSNGNGSLNDVVSYMVAYGLLVHTLTPIFLRGMYTVEQLTAKLTTLKTAVNNLVADIENKYPELPKLYNELTVTDTNCKVLKIVANTTYGRNP